LPEKFQSYLENVVVIIEDEPPDDMPDVMGLYVYVVSESGTMWIFASEDTIK